MRSLEHRFDGEPGRTHRNLLWKIVVLVVFVMVMVWFRAYYGSLENYKKGEECLKENQTMRAITFFDRSLRWYTPWNPYVEKSARRLWDIGERAMADGDTRVALIAFRTIRSGFYGMTHFVLPGEDWIEKSESRIKALLTREAEERGRGEEGGASRPRGHEENKSPQPDIFWSVVVEVGFLGWIGSVIGLIFVGWRPQGRSSTRRFSFPAWGGLGLAFFVLWVVGMMRA